MALITHLYCVYRWGTGGSVRMSDATPEEVLERILIVKEGVDRFRDVILTPEVQASAKRKAYLCRWVEEFLEEIDDLWDHYLAKLRARSNV